MLGRPLGGRDLLSWLGDGKAVGCLGKGILLIQIAVCWEP